MAGHQVTWSPRETLRPDSYQVSFSLSLFFSFFFSFFSFLFSLFLFSRPVRRRLRPAVAPLSWLPAPLPRPRPRSHVAQVEVSLLYPPVGRDLLGLVALHVLLHGGEAGAVLRADGALVGRGAVVRSQVLDHGRVVPGALVAQLALEGLLTCGGVRERARTEGEGRERLPGDAAGGGVVPHATLTLGGEDISPSSLALFL